MKRFIASTPIPRSSRALTAHWLLVRSPMIWSAIVWLLMGGLASACPFCSAVKASLTSLRADSLAVVLAECTSATEERATFSLRTVLSGRDELDSDKTLEVMAEIVPYDVERARLADLAPGDLVLAIASEAPVDAAFDKIWILIRVDETSYAYIAQAPLANEGAAARLAYFARFLEHPDPLIARDAYREFGAAPFDQVAKAADSLPMAEMRKWLFDPNVPEERKGFYGMALGLPTTAVEREANLKVLRQYIDADASDFRAGFDGVLGGCLLAAGEEGLSYIESKFLADPDAAEGDARHALTALRFYREYGREIPVERLSAAARRLLDRPGFAAEVIADLSRWKSWESQDAVVACFDVENKESAALDRAVVGFLKASPKPEAKAALAELRRQASKRVLAAEKQFSAAPASKQ